MDITRGLNRLISDIDFYRLTTPGIKRHLRPLQRILISHGLQPLVVRGKGGTSLLEANGDVPLDGVAFSRLD